MSARMDSPIECDCAELSAHQSIEMMLRRLMAEQVNRPPAPGDHNQIQTQYRIVFSTYLAQLESVRAISQAKEQA